MRPRRGRDAVVMRSWCGRKPHAAAACGQRKQICYICLRFCFCVGFFSSLCVLVKRLSRSAVSVNVTSFPKHLTKLTKRTQLGRYWPHAAQINSQRTITQRMRLHTNGYAANRNKTTNAHNWHCMHTPTHHPLSSIGEFNAAVFDRIATASWPRRERTVEMHPKTRVKF